jgi:hypothetical protein
MGIKHILKSLMLSFASATRSVSTKNLIGLDIKSASSAIDALKASGSSVRVLLPNSMVTMDYRPDRYNVRLDAAGKIIGVTMG